MKKNLLKLSLIAFLTFTISSCGSDDDGGSSEPQTTFGVSINGQQFSPTSLPPAQMSNSNRYMVISATNVNTSEVVSISIGVSQGTADALMADTYSIDGSTNTVINYFDGTNGYQTNNNGQVVITDLNTDARTISGSFSGTASGSFGSSTVYTLSNGQFSNLPYTVQ